MRRIKIDFTIKLLMIVSCLLSISEGCYAGSFLTEVCLYFSLHESFFDKRENSKAESRMNENRLLGAIISCLIATFISKFTCEHPFFVETLTARSRKKNGHISYLSLKIVHRY